MIELECPECGGFIYKPYVLENRPYKCVRCECTFSEKEIGDLFKKDLLESSESLKDNKEIKDILKKELF